MANHKDPSDKRYKEEVDIMFKKLYSWMRYKQESTRNGAVRMPDVERFVSEALGWSVSMVRAYRREGAKISDKRLVVHPANPR